MLSYDDTAACLHAEHRFAAEHTRQGWPFADGQIAVIAVAHNLTLVTRNVNDFQDVAGLHVVDRFAR